MITRLNTSKARRAIVTEYTLSTPLLYLKSERKLTFLGRVRSRIEGTVHKIKSIHQTTVIRDGEVPTAWIQK